MFRRSHKTKAQRPSGFFTKTVEDFQCERCATLVAGSGYTNHCPKCLWSKHVDIYPGDRLERCRGLMEPVALERRGGQEVLIHRCTGCGKFGRNKVSPDDAREAILRLGAAPMPVELRARQLPFD